MKSIDVIIGFSIQNTRTSTTGKSGWVNFAMSQLKKGRTSSSSPRYIYCTNGIRGISRCVIIRFAA